MTSKAKRELLLFLLAMGVVAADQLSKLWVRGHLWLGESIPLAGPIRLTHVHNSGVAFGFLPNHTFPIFLTIAMSIAIIVLSYRLAAFHPWPVKVSLGLILGGGVGNLIDRLPDGYVTDFIDLQVWPVFNLADSSIVVGTILLAAFLLFPDGKRPPE